MAKDLRHFLNVIERKYPDLLMRVTEQVNPNRFEISAFLDLVERKNLEKVILFEKALSADETRSTPFVSNIFFSRGICALALDLERSNDRMGLVEEFARREERPGQIEKIPESKAPCKEVIWEKDAANLQKLPIPMFHTKDAGPYFTMTCAMKALDGDFYDITFNKNWVKSPTRMSVSAHAHHHLEGIFSQYEAKGLRAPLIVVLGHHPAFYLSSCCLTSFGNNDYLTASSFLGEPLRLTPSHTWGDRFLVPADAEIIVEAEVLPGVREKQNPFGEIAGYYQPEMMVPVAEVTAITMKKDPITQGIFPGRSEHWNLGGIPKEGSVYSVIKRNIPRIKAIHLPPSGCGRFSCTISIKKEFENEPRRAAMAAFTEMPNLKLAIVVDEDVDVYNEREVQWAMVTRTHWDKDIEMIRKVQSFRGWLGDAVVIIDATRPKGVDFPEKNEIPPYAIVSAEKRWKL
jgi:2,5-furandicarboxylate decarboxylase 1